MIKYVSYIKDYTNGDLVLFLCLCPPHLMNKHESDYPHGLADEKDFD